MPEIPTGSTRAPLRVASSEAPGRGAASRPSRLRVPSGMSVTIPPASRAALATRYAAMSLPLTGERHAEAMADYRCLAQFGLMVSDSSRGSVQSLAGRTLIRYDLADVLAGG